MPVEIKAPGPNRVSDVLELDNCDASRKNICIVFLLTNTYCSTLRVRLLGCVYFSGMHDRKFTRDRPDDLDLKNLAP